MTDDAFSLEILEDMGSLNAEAFEELSGPTDYPFLDFGFLRALERSTVVGARSGWIPRHFVLRKSGSLIAFVPGYIKLHSFGEFVFDQAWAQCSELQLGTPYYPKLVVGVPFTPTTGPRFLIRRGLDPDEKKRVVGAIASAIVRLCEEVGLSSAHILFCDAELSTTLSELGWCERSGIQYQFHNSGLSSFDDFLATFRAKRRANIRRERREIENRGIRIEVRTGSALSPSDAGLAYRLYLTTVDKYVWGRRYLNQQFFDILVRELPHLIHFVTAVDSQNDVVAGAFNLIGSDAIYGRYWGCFVHEAFLHFEVCMYSGIEETIRRGLVRFEAGAGGEHKHGRGLVPSRTRSMHYLFHPTLRALVTDYCARESEQIERIITSG